MPTTLTYRVPYADTDQMGVVYYANFFVYFERVRNEFLRESGYSYKQMEKDGFMLPVLDAHCEYRQPALYDDLLTLTAQGELVSPARVRMHCQVLRGTILLCEGYSTHACVRVESRKPARLPEILVKVLTLVKADLA